MVRVSARFAVPVPLAETLCAGWLLAQAGLQVPAGPLSVAPVHAEEGIELDADGMIILREYWGKFLSLIARLQSEQIYDAASQ